MIAFTLSRTRWLPKPGSITESLITRFPRSYLGVVTLVALTGYAYILLFPFLVLAGTVNIYAAIMSGDVIDWQFLLIWSAIVIISGLVSFRQIQIKPVLPAGLTITEDKAPELFSLVQLVRSHYKRPAIHRIVITGNYELNIIRTPKRALPVWLSNTLVIGLPVMQSLSQKQFECLLAGRIGQHSGRYNLLTNWLYQLRAIWQQYHTVCSKQKGFGFEPLKWFFAVYSPLYRIVSTRAARQDELNADTYAMQLYNDEEVREMITADSLCRCYLRKQYWPAVYKVASADIKQLPTPHSKMAAAIYTTMTGEKLQSVMATAIKHKPSSRDTIPSLQSRIKNIGHDKARMGKLANETAAARYLGSSINNVIVVINKLWQKNYLEKRKQQRRRKRKQAAGT